MIMAILQARTSSTRLPGKVLKPILGTPMIIKQIERVKRSKMIDLLVVATSVDPSDDKIEQLCFSNGIKCFRGSLKDVLERYYFTLKTYDAKHVVRLTGDCPLTDPVVIDEVIELHLRGRFDYTSNVIKRTYPVGLDVEILTSDCLKDVYKNASLPSHREHVTLYIREHTRQYNIGNLVNEVDLSHLRWTVDEVSDFLFVERIYEALYPVNPEFSTVDILQFLKTRPN